MEDEEIKKLYATLNILCVEDDPQTREMYEAVFSLIFKEVFTAQDGLEGFEVFQNEAVDIILTDYNMPKCNGLEMVKKIRAIDKSIPIILLTALESIEMLQEAIALHITSFLKKPFDIDAMYTTFNVAVKSVLLDRCLIQKQKQQILYNDYQEQLTLSKELVITKNTLPDGRLAHFHCQTLYKPKDTLSGDSYIIEEVANQGHLVFLVDGMGKGIPASVTAMLCSSFVHYYLQKIKAAKKEFSLESLLNELHLYVTPNLLEDEVVSLSFLYFHTQSKELHYALFSMPPVLYMNQNSNEVLKIKSNNTPFCDYNTNFHIDTLEYSTISKMLIYSDGLSESPINQIQCYASQLSDDFKVTDSIEVLEQLLTQKTLELTDDVSVILLNSVESDVFKQA